MFTAAGAGVKINLLFFTKGRPTTRIWYYDLSAQKVTKRQALTFEEHFTDFMQRLPERSDSERSWSVDFTARQRQVWWRSCAAVSAAKSRGLVRLRSPSRAFHWVASSVFCWAWALSGAAVSAAWTKEARQLIAQAQEIEDAVYDLKTVNPHVKTDQDARTPAEWLDLIEAKGQEISAALARLRSA